MKIAGIVPAAGLSSRMGAFKPLLPVDAEDGHGCVTVLERAVEVLRSGGAEKIFVVTGKNAEKLRDIIKKTGAEEIYNSNYMLGMNFSVLAGIRAAMEYDAALLLPCDCPAVTSDTVEKVISASDPEHFAVACYKGKKGHPLWIPRRYFLEIMYSGSIKNVTRTYEEELVRVETGREGVVLDMDTPRAYQRVLDYLIEGETDIAELARNKRIILARHGETVRHAGPIFMGQYDPALSPEGFSGALATCNKIVALSPDTKRVFSSDLKRASAMGAMLSAKLKTGLVLTPALREISLGKWDGRLVSDIAATFPDEYAKRGASLLTFKPDGGENFYDLRYRVSSWLAEVLKKEESPDIVIVTHAGVIAAIYSAVTGLEMDPEKKLPLGGVLTITGEKYKKA